MLLISWNVNGIRAIINKGFWDIFQEFDADIFCLQETKARDHQIELLVDNYYVYMNSAVKKGYSGTLVFSKQEPLNVTYGLNLEDHDQEGRVITLEFANFFLVNVYTPNSQEKLKRLDYRMTWDDVFLNHLNALKASKPVIVCGDLNVAHMPIDLKNPQANTKNAGFSKEEREKFSNILASGFLDTYRYFNPDKENVYSWWSYRFKARERNAGWRIDYFLVSKNLQDKLICANVFNNVFGSDHCPVGLEIKLD